MWEQLSVAFMGLKLGQMSKKLYILLQVLVAVFIFLNVSWVLARLHNQLSTLSYVLIMPICLSVVSVYLNICLDIKTTSYNFFLRGINYKLT